MGKHFDKGHAGNAIHDEIPSGEGADLEANTRNRNGGVLADKKYGGDLSIEAASTEERFDIEFLVQASD